MYRNNNKLFQYSIYRVCRFNHICHILQLVDQYLNSILFDSTATANEWKKRKTHVTIQTRWKCDAKKCWRQQKKKSNKFHRGRWLKFNFTFVCLFQFSSNGFCGLLALSARTQRNLAHSVEHTVYALICLFYFTCILYSAPARSCKESWYAQFS